MAAIQRDVNQSFHFKDKFLLNTITSHTAIITHSQ